jgi:uncharacterized protein
MISSRCLILLCLAAASAHAATFLEIQKEKKVASENAIKRKMQSAIVSHETGQTQASLAQVKELIEQGLPEAMNLLGYWYQTGSGVERSLENALRYYSDAASKDYAPAMVNLAKLLIAKPGSTDEDKKKAAEWLLKASEDGEADARIALAQMHAQGMGVPKNLDEARNWASKAAERGSSEGLWLLYLLHTGQFGLDPGNKPTEGLAALVKAAEAGHEKASLDLADRLNTGSGFAKNPEAATALLNKAADHASAEAFYRLGKIAAAKGGDLSIPLQYFQAAAKMGHPEAQNEFGLRLRKGKGTPADPAAAAKWFSLAMSRGSEAARVNMADLLRTGTGVDKDPAQCLELANASLKNGYVPAATLLARYYLAADEPDAARATLLARWALSHGDATAADVEKEASAAASPESLVGAEFWLKSAVPNIVGLPGIEEKK